MSDLNENKSLSNLAALKSDSSSKDEQEFQEYKSARSSTRLITPKGFRITFTNYTYLTQSEEAMAYLDEQIASGVPGITKGGLKTSSDLDPMESMRKKFFAEFEADRKAKEVAAAMGEVPDMGTYQQGNVKPAGTNKIVAGKK